jgi:hypothetical protein
MRGPKVKKTWKPIVAGILDIVFSVISLWFLFALSLEGAVFWSIFPKSMFGLNNPSTVYLIITIPLLFIPILTLLGGIYALKRRKWGLAFAGSIAAILSWTPVVLLLTPTVIFGSAPLGILVVILIAKSKGEFE